MNYLNRDTIKENMNTSFGSNSSIGSSNSGIILVKFNGNLATSDVEWCKDDSFRIAIDSFRNKKKLLKLNWEKTRLTKDGHNSPIDIDYKVSSYENNSKLLFNVTKTTSYKVQNPEHAPDSQTIDDDMIDVDDESHHVSSSNSKLLKTKYTEAFAELRKLIKDVVDPNIQPKGLSYFNMENVNAQGAAIGNNLANGASFSFNSNTPSSSSSITASPALPTITPISQSLFDHAIDEHCTQPLSIVDGKAVEDASKLEFEGLVLNKGKDTSLPMEFFSNLNKCSDSVCKIEIKKNGKEFAGTGIIIYFDNVLKSGLLMTNHHVLPDAPTAINSILLFDFHDNKSGSKLADLDPTSFFVAEEKVDCAIVAFKFKKKTGKSRSAIPLTLGNAALLANDHRVLIIHHPRGKPKRVSLQFGKVETKNQYLLYRNDTQRGSSGAPVLNYNFKLVALHHQGISRKDSRGNKIQFDGSVWIEGTHDFSLLRHDANQGVLVDHIIRWLIKTIAPTMKKDKLTVLLKLLQQDQSQEMAYTLLPIISQFDSLPDV